MFPTPTESHYAVYIDENGIDQVVDDDGVPHGPLQAAIQKWDQREDRILISGGHPSENGTVAEQVYEEVIDHHGYLDPVEGMPVLTDDARTIQDHVENAYAYAEQDGATEVVFIGDADYLDAVRTAYDALEETDARFGTYRVD